MNTKELVGWVGIAALTVLVGCSTPKPATAVAAAPQPPPPLVEYDLPLEAPSPQPLPRLCKLGATCLAMDPRPFEPCLLSTIECRDKATEPSLVEQSQWTPPRLMFKSK